MIHTQKVSEIKFKECETSVRFLEDAIKNSHSTDSIRYKEPKVLSRNVYCPSLSYVSNMLTLNEIENIAFRIIGKSLLESVRKSELGLRTSDPLRAHLQGAAGTGKSRIIDALKYLATQWGYDSSIVTVAPTGIAAVNIMRETVHSKFNLRGRKNVSSKDLELWSKVHLLVWDEISM